MAIRHQIVHDDLTQAAILALTGMSEGDIYTPSDAANVFLVLTARQLNPGIFIMARASNNTDNVHFVLYEHA